MRKPNILLFITDQHKADHLGVYGNKIVKTPNLDAIARRGWRADRFYVASPICMPNRSSLMTGRMPSVHGARHNGIPLALESVTFVDRLREAGYETALVGKSHLQNMTGKGPHWPGPADPPMDGEARRAAPGNYDQEWGPLWRRDPAHDLETPFYGFSRVALAVDHGDQVWGHYWRWLEKNHPEAAATAGPEHAIPTPDYELSRCGQAWRTRVPEELSTSAYIGNEARSLIREYAQAGKPFFMMCSFPDPHHPFTPHGKYWDMYGPEAVDLPESFHACAEHEAAPPVQWLYRQRDEGKAVKSTPALFACTEREAREAIALNYGSISHIDAVIGEVTAELAQQGVSDNTIIIFMSDHGDYLGDHQLLWKGPIHYQSLIRTPFIWMDPTRPNDHANGGALASTIDVAATILDRVGITPYNGMQGKSLLPLMAGAQASLRDDILVEEEGQRIMFGFDRRVRMRTLVNAEYRVSVYEGCEWGELYDLRADPMELENLWRSPGHAQVRQSMLHALALGMIEHSETSPAPTALA
ncbi:sulfatase-like hydrolase/transferase [Pusillimonas sp. TS35]|uniref:sulfatase family protein n=1 Tax=Paracandidimonas lactea TaxID=2895524 RepID=UPI00136A29BB|nr:sulfatase-like hydrolase/transferase [Paracandidimonas lactea]MYN13472.1 sulfatase-like hydrolase/transferase [Pusillimonas sp. TS35]